MKDFKQLLHTIERIYQYLQQRAVNAVNQALTIRNWLVRFHTVEFELKGKDRAHYGEALIDTLADKLGKIKGIDRRSLFRFRSFYLTYPHLSSYLLDADVLRGLREELLLPNIVGTLSPHLQETSIVGTVTPQLGNMPKVPPEKIITKLSYSHIELILKIDDPLKRTFYEIECINGTWSVRELKRQIASLYYERSGLSAKRTSVYKYYGQNSCLFFMQKKNDRILNEITYDEIPERELQYCG
jgi:hypothetical protein